MKYAAIITALLLVIALCGVGYLYLTSNVTIDHVTAHASPADQQAEYFASLCSLLSADALPGTPYAPAPSPSEAEGYRFVEYHVLLKNDCLIPMEGIEVQLIPAPGDVLSLPGDGGIIDLPPQSSGEVTVTLLTTASGHISRELVVTGQTFGISQTLRTRYVK